VSGVIFLLGNLTNGGSETKTVRLANRMKKSGIEVHIVYLGPPHTLRSAIDDDVPVKFLDRRGKFSLRALRELKTFVEHHDIGTVFCINHHPLIYGWPACHLADHRIRCIGAVNTYEFTSMRDRFFMLIYAYILRRCDLVIFGSRAQQRLWTRKYRLRDQASRVIYNGVDQEHFREEATLPRDIRKSLGIDEDAIVIGCVAHLRPEKSHTDLLAGFKRTLESSDSKAVLLLVGDGPDEPQLRAYAETHYLTEHVRFCGKVRDVRPYLGLMDIFVLTSATEVFSNAILEAMASGLPIVCSAVGGSVEMVEDGVTGYTFARHDIDGLVGALQELIINTKKREKFGQSGAAKVRAEFSIESMDRQYAEVVSSTSFEPGFD